MAKKVTEDDTDKQTDGLAIVNIENPLNFVTEETNIFALISQKFPVTSIEDGAKLVDIYEKVSQVRENNLDREHKRNIENRQQNTAEEEFTQKLELEKRKQETEADEKKRQVDLENRKFELEKVKEGNKELDRGFRRDLERREQDRLWQITYLAFATGVCLMLIGVSGGAIIAASSLTIPASGLLIKKVKDRNKEAEKE